MSFWIVCITGTLNKAWNTPYICTEYKQYLPRNSFYSMYCMDVASTELNPYFQFQLNTPIWWRRHELSSLIYLGFNFLGRVCKGYTHFSSAIYFGLICIFLCEVILKILRLTRILNSKTFWIMVITLCFFLWLQDLIFKIFFADI